MNKYKAHSCFLIFICLLMVSCSANRQPQQEQPRTITVNGNGTVYVMPDRAIMVFAVITQNWVAQTAVQENARIMNEVISALQKAGVRESDISTSDYTVNQQGTWNNGVYTPGRYRADNTVTVVIQTIDMVGTLIDTAIGAGANSLTSLSFKVADTETALRQARTLAVQDAQNAAALFAGASGCAVGNVISFVENRDTYFPNPQVVNAIDAATNTATPISAGKIAVTSSITVTYALQ